MKNIELIAYGFYKCMSFEKGEKPYLDQLHELFIDGSILIFYNGEEPQRLTVSTFIEAFQKNIKKENFQSLQGKELSSKTELFGSIAQRFSVYEFRSDTRLIYGVAMMQLIQVKKQWLITSMIWEDESEKYKIPSYYLQNHHHPI